MRRWRICRRCGRLNCIEHDDAACATRRAAGLRTLQADVAALDPLDFAPCWGLIASGSGQAHAHGAWLCELYRFVGSYSRTGGGEHRFVGAILPVACEQDDG